jgi:circadian clock protein KaiC
MARASPERISMNRSVPRSPVPSPTAQERLSTGIAGLDDVLGGGLPAHHLYLVEGEPGAGKTTLGLQFLLNGLAQGERCLYISLSETSSELRAVAASHGWSLDGLAIYEPITPESLSAEVEQSILHPSEIELGETTRNIIAEVDRLQPQRLVLDSLSELRMLAQDPLRYRRQILALKHFFTRSRPTVLLLDDGSARVGDLQLHSIVHGVLTLSQTVGEYGDDKRYLRVVKLRGTRFRGGEHDFRLDTGGIAAYPRLVAAEHQVEFAPVARSTGNAALDTMLGGGLASGSSTLFAGPSGVGKTTTALACIAAALQRGERASYYLFDEGLGTLLIRCDTLGIPIRRYMESGQLEMSALDPAEVLPGEFAAMVRHAVEERGATTVAVDSLNAYLQAMPGGKFLMLQMHELLMYLNQSGVATLLVLGQHGLFGESRSEVDLSYLSDTVLLFRYFEARGGLRKALSVVKSRTSHHELTIREFRLGRGGMEVGAALTDFEGVMKGVASYRGSQPLLSEPAGAAA